MQIGTIKDEKPVIYGAQVPGQISLVPYAEPTWLAKGFKSPYFDDVRSTLKSSSVAGPMAILRGSPSVFLHVEHFGM